jgi:hypothetical protein
MSAFGRGDHGDLFLKICAEHSRVVPSESYTELMNEDQRLRNITRLQQKAQALENEMAERKQVEEALLRTQAELESQVQQRTAALRQLSSRLLSLQDTERRRIARELHDSLGQYLVGLKFNVDILRQSPGREELWSEADQLMQQCMSEVRTLSYLLHPPTMDAAGFASAARWYVEGFGQRSGIDVTLDAPHDMGRLPDAIELALFRVLQEALTNVHRHSGASAAHVLISNDVKQVVLEIKDNGRDVIVRQFAPMLLHRPFHLLPLALQLVRVHFVFSLSGLCFSSHQIDPPPPTAASSAAFRHSSRRLTGSMRYPGRRSPPGSVWPVSSNRNCANGPKARCRHP